LHLVVYRHSIDCARFSNVARFFNHDCAPNLDDYKVFIDTDDPFFFYIAFFANRFVLQ